MSQQYYYSSLTGPQLDAALLQISQAAENAANAAASAAAAKTSAQAAEAFAAEINGYSETESDLRFGSAIRLTAQGTAIAVTDGADAPGVALRIFGKSWQTGTPAPTAPVYPVHQTGTVREEITGASVDIPALMGIPIHSSKNAPLATFTDASGEKWLCDEWEPVSGSLTQRLFTITLDGTEAWTQSTSGAFNLGSLYYDPLYNFMADSNYADALQMCSHFRAVGYYEMEEGCVVSFGGIAGQTLSFRYDACPDVASWKAYLAAQYDAGTPVTVILRRTNAKVIPGDSAMSVRGPVFRLVSDAHMDLTYIGDTKTYIDNKLAAISAAMLKE